MDVYEIYNKSNDSVDEACQVPQLHIQGANGWGESLVSIKQSAVRAVLTTSTVTRRLPAATFSGTRKSSSTYITDGEGKMAAVEVTKKPRLDMKKKMEEEEKKNRMMKSVVFDEQYIIRLRSCYLIFVFS